MKIDTYVGRAGEELTEEQWKAKRYDLDYTNLRVYQSKRFSIRAFWNGKLFYYTKRESEVLEKWLPFELVVIEDKDGVATPRTKDCGRFATESALINAYEDFLVRHGQGYWAPSTRSGEFHFIEQGNLAKATKDAPAYYGVDDELMATAGSW